MGKFRKWLTRLGMVAFCFSDAKGSYILPNLRDISGCPGYTLTNVVHVHSPPSSAIIGDLILAGDPCDAYGDDLKHLRLSVDYEDETRIHLKIWDASRQRYEVPESVLPRPSNKDIQASASQITLNYTASPFTFQVVRRSTNEILFDTSRHPLIFEPQYWRIKTDLPPNANLYGLGEHTDSFRLPTYNHTRTLWSRDSPGVPPGTNLYGNHPIYFEHRKGGTHGVFLRNSNAMDVKLDDLYDRTTLEFNVIGGIIDLYFLAGSESSPAEAAKQYSDIVGRPAEIPYWSLGFHQCRWGYSDFVEVAHVISNYSSSGIPLETMWIDIDYMNDFKIFTADPEYFPTARLREIVDYLHLRNQHFVLMVDPAVGYLPGENYQTFDRGVQDDIFLKNPNGSYHLSIVWPGVTVYPDWFHPNITEFWNNEFKLFFDPATGIDIDGVWIDMNEPASFCLYPCLDPFEQAREQDRPPPRPASPPKPDTPIFQHDNTFTIQPRGGFEKRSLLAPDYVPKNSFGTLSEKTAHVTAVHHNGLKEYDTHNLYGTMMSAATRRAMLARRPKERPFIITRSTFAGAGSHVGKWLGDNLSTWAQYRFSIAGMLGMASIYQIPMVGSDVCGFGGNVTVDLCARWATLGAFNPFFRNHNIEHTLGQEFYLWDLTTEAAKKAIDMRYRLLDYIYTAFHRASVDGSPVLSPLWFKYPADEKTWDIDLQFLYGDSILVSPVTEEGSTSVDIYLPDDIFYDFLTLAPVRGHGTTITLKDISLVDIPVHIVGGSVIPLRVSGAMTTTALRTKDFALVVAPGLDGEAQGSLYIDDGTSLVQDAISDISISYRLGKVSLTGSFAYSSGVKLASVIVLGLEEAPLVVLASSGGVSLGELDVRFDEQNGYTVITVDRPLDHHLDLVFEV
ncbi:alpha-glucosidase [Sistotremastrum niveocremeum HHB9708]|uniref:Probable alpha/beta-glucosidase agdC n=1 Tax=Sistotremastrum niveocremeum HHB9708 TaxID=1314777 RepID=A0A164QPG3_9AGAM|nr:alpha-glucosidase [Sistotremastrum niveocremeum HHB9708]